MYKAHWRHLLSISLLVYIVIALVSLLLAAILGWFGALLGFLISIVGLFWVQGALVKAVEDVRDGRADLSLSETFASVRPKIGSIAVAGILAGLAIGIGLLLLIAPGLFLMTIWAVIIPAIVLENLSAGQSFARSRELVRGYGWGVLGVIVLSILILIGVQLLINLALTPLADWLESFVSSVVGGGVTAPFIALILTVLYFRLRQAKESAAEPVEPTPSPAV
jgi:hypothetical protein